MENNTENQEQSTALQTTENLQLKKLNAGVEKVKELTELASKYKNIVVTKDTLKEATKAWQELRNTRLDLQAIEAHNNDVLNKAKKLNASNGTKLIELIQPTENTIKTSIDAIKKAEEKKKQEEAAAEKKRVDDIKATITALEVRIPMIRTMKSVEELDKIALDVSTKENTFSEFNEEGNAMVRSVLNSIEARKLTLADEKALETQKLREKLEGQRNMNPPKEAWIQADEEAVFPDTKEVTFETKQHGDTTVDFSSGAGRFQVRSSNEGDVTAPSFGKLHVTSSVNNGIKFPTKTHEQLSYGGYDFSIAILPENAHEKITNFIKEVIDELPM